MTLRVRRIYDPADPSDGRRYLVDRLWPRGLSKKDAVLDGWLRELGPSDELRRWFRHDPERWPEFKRRYFEELLAKEDAWKELVRESRRRTVTLLFSARDPRHNNAVALALFLRRRQRARRAGKK